LQTLPRTRRSGTGRSVTFSSCKWSRSIASGVVSRLVMGRIFTFHG
jgi:hypothetical protein